MEADLQDLYGSSFLNSLVLLEISDLFSDTRASEIPVLSKLEDVSGLVSREEKSLFPVMKNAWTDKNFNLIL